MPFEPAWVSHTHGITTVDARYTRPAYASVHVIERAGRAALVDSGTNDSVPHVLAALAGLRIAPAAVEWLFITHVHLDHAGGAGSLLRELPNARVLAHPRAAPHLVDPTRLVAGTRDVYGPERFAALYGVPLPIEADRVVSTRDGETFMLGDTPLGVLHTPGHALHHHVLHDPTSRSVFTGDTFGLSYRQLHTDRGPFILPTTTPTQFDPDQLLASVRRIVALEPEAVYLTHYGRATGVAALGAALEARIQDLVGIARRHATDEQRERAIRDEIWTRWSQEAREHGCMLDEASLFDLLSNDIELDAQGLVVWLERSARTA